MSAVKVKKMLELLCAEAGFLVDSKTRQQLDHLGKEEQEVVQVDSILRALNIQTEDQIEQLMTYFFTDVGDEDTYSLNLGLKIRSEYL